MNKKKISILLAILIPGFLFSVVKLSQTKPTDIIATWLNEEGTAKVRIFKAKNKKYYGKIVWLKEPNRNGKPKMDDENPDKAKRKKPIMGMQILRGFSYDAGDKDWSGGTIYDPKTGKTYSCTITKKGDKAIKVRGYIGISLIGKTTVWTKQ